MKRALFVLLLLAPAAVEGDALVLNPLPDPETMPPLYEGGKIVQPLKTRIYLNCSHVIGVTVDPMPVGP